MPLDVCPSCGQSLYWCGKSGVCDVVGKVIFEVSNRFVVEGSHDPATGWKFVSAHSDQIEAEWEAEGSSDWKHVRVVDTEVS